MIYKVQGFELDEFTRGYIECALWASNDESNEQGGEPLDENYCIEDLARETLGKMVSDCKRFQEENKEDLGNARGPDCNGYDFWLTRNRHGAGFWDRGLGEVGERLTKACEAFGEVSLYVGDDGKIYQAQG